MCVRVATLSRSRVFDRVNAVICQQKVFTAHSPMQKVPAKTTRNGRPTALSCWVGLRWVAEMVGLYITHGVGGRSVACSAHGKRVST